MIKAPVRRPLAGITVIDLVEGPLGGITRIHADLGAHVIRVELAGRAAGASVDGARGAIAYTIAHQGKDIRRLDQTSDIGCAALDGLLARADLIVENVSGDAAGILDLAALRARRPALTVMTVSMFGSGNSYSDWQATDPVLHALSGELCRSGIRGREPLLPPGEIGLQCAMAQAGYASTLSIYAAAVSGVGDHLDFSALDGAVQALDPGFGIGGSATLGRAAKHLSPKRPAKGLQYPILPCADGHVRICLLAPRQWQGMFRWMGEPADFASPDFNKTVVRYKSPDLIPAIASFFADKTRAQLEREGQAHGVPIAGLMSLDECLKADHLAARGAFARAALPDGRDIPVPNGVIEIDGVRMAAGRDWDEGDPATRRPVANGSAARPLAGIRVLDLGVIVVGGEQGRLLADMGADVVKVEASAFPDGTRHSYLPTGLSVSFAAGHRNKRSLGLNLRDPGGKAIFRRLVAEADVVLSNFKPGTMESLGFGYPELAAINPGIIMAESSAFGSTGPWSGRMGYGPLVRAAAGVTGKWRYADDPVSYSDSITIYPDHVAARIGATAVLALLIRRAETGRGGTIAISQMEVMLGHFAAEIAGAALGEKAGDVPDAPWGVYQAQGDDDWCVLTVRGDADWHRLAAVLGRGDLSVDRELSDRSGRVRRRTDLDAAVAAWMSTRTADTAMRDLQAAGVPAGKMLRIGDLPDFGYYRERGLFRVERHPYMDEEVVAERYPVASFMLAEPEQGAAPLAGEHSAAIMREWLGLSDEEIDRLVSEHVLEPTNAEIAQMVSEGRGRGDG